MWHYEGFSSLAQLSEGQAEFVGQILAKMAESGEVAVVEWKKEAKVTVEQEAQTTVRNFAEMTSQTE